MRRGSASAAVLVLAAMLPAGARAADDESEVASFEKNVANTKVQSDFVNDIIQKGEASELDQAKQNYGEGETQYLLENYDACAAALLQAVNATSFHGDPNYPQALYYLGKSLLETGAYVEAKKYFRLAVEVMSPKQARQYQDSLISLIKLSDLTGDSEGVDKYYEAAKTAGGLKPEVIYLYAKWTAKRLDISVRERDIHAAEDFGAIKPGDPYFPQALYYRGALLIELGHVPESIPLFQALTLVDQANEPKVPELRDLAHLALGRVYTTQNKLEAAIDEYHAIRTESPDYMEGLFERAEVYVRQKDFENAIRTSDTLLLLGKDSPVAPQAEILKANLLLKMGEIDQDAYAKAVAGFNNVIQTYQPVRDQIRAIIDRPDPVAYFDELLKRDPSADFTKQLPKPAQGFVDPTTNVAAAHAIQKQLGGGKQGIDDSTALATKMLDALANGGLSTFPQFQEANVRAIEISNRLVQIERDILHEQIKILGTNIPADVHDRLVKMETDRADLDRLFLALPSNQEEYEKRLRKFRENIASLERKSFALRRELDTTNAVLTGLEKYWKDTRDQRKPDPAAEAERDTDFAQWHTLAEQLDERRKALDKEIDTARLSAANEAAGGKTEDELRDRYRQQLADMRAIIAQVNSNVSAAGRPLLERSDAVRAEIDRQQTVLSKMREEVRRRAREKVEGFRQGIVAEQVNLDDDTKVMGTLSDASGQLIGRIAVGAFREVAQDFYDIVLHGDVGLVDVAWSRKQSRTEAIEKFAKDKEEAIKMVEDRFKEVLGDAE